MSFDEWFKSKGYDEQYREQFKIVWNASLESACSRFIDIEGTDFDTQKALEA